MIFYRSNNTTPVLALSPSSPYGVGIGNASPGSLLDIGLAGTTTGTLRLEGITSGYVQISPSAAAGSWTLTLPTGVPASNGYVLSSTTAGVTSWVANGGAGATALSSLTSGTAVNTIDNTSMAQTWTWNSLTTQTAFTLSSSSLTNGNILSIQNTAASATSTGKVLSISDATTGSGYGVYSVMSGKGNSGYAGYFTNTGSTNTGYAGYFINTDTSTSINYGVYGTAASGSGYGGYFSNTNTNVGSIALQANVNGIASENTFPFVVSNNAAVSGLGVGMILETLNDTDASNRNWSIGANVTAGGLLEFASSTSNSGSPIGNTPTVVITSTGTVDVDAAQTNAGACCDLVFGYSSGEGIASRRQAGGNQYDLEFYTNYTEALEITNTGSVGIGTASVQPGAELTVKNATVSGTTYGGYFSSATTGAGYAVYGTMTAHGNTGYAGYFNNTDTGNDTNSGVYGIASAGNGSGVYGFGTYGVIGQSNNFTGVFGLSFGSSGVGVSGQSNAAANTGYGGYFSNSATSGANYGVYATNASSSGYGGYFTNTGTGAVNYGLYASTSSATGWAGYFDGNVYVNGTITMSSDRSLKKDIEPLDTGDALDEIAALRPVAFTWKKTGVSDMGLIAQEVDTVFPELVTHSGADETLALKYTSLIAPMIASIQELKKRDDELEVENATLRRDFNAYKEAHP